MSEAVRGFENTLSQLETMMNARAILPIQNTAHTGLKEVIKASSETLRQQYEENIKTHGVSPTDRVRIVRLHRSLEDVPEAKEALRLILKEEIVKMSEQSEKESGVSRESRLHQCVLTLWRCLQPETMNRSEMEIAILAALFPETDTAVSEENQAAAQQELFQAERISDQTDQRTIDGIKIFEDDELLPSGLQAQINGPGATEDRAFFLEWAMTKLRRVTFYPLESLVVLHYNPNRSVIVNIDVRMRNVNEGKHLIARLKALNGRLVVFR
ncbi:MAG: hypothetical protein Q9207_004192 [Kuettlingeria erythrocarpa]